MSLTSHSYSVEGAVVIIAACIPLLKPLVDMALGAAFLGSRKDSLPSKDSEPLSSADEKYLKPKKSARTLTNLIKLAAGTANDSDETILPVAHRPGPRGQGIECRTDIHVSYHLSDYSPSPCPADDRQSNEKRARSQASERT